MWTILKYCSYRVLVQMWKLTTANADKVMLLTHRKESLERAEANTEE